ncbi:hypothetical protein [Bacillus piscicola]|uniref:hypothetical protein n=1 Tax=Bacillus piscicola TaxID=1632684 RepID=UPI001F08A135|nr:hypothetical protein [Bacillus piscicola]
MLMPCVVIHRIEDVTYCKVLRHRGFYDTEVRQVFYDDNRELKLSRCDFHAGYFAYDVTDYAPIRLRSLPEDHFVGFDFFGFYQRMKRISLYDFLVNDMRRDTDVNLEIP